MSHRFRVLWLPALLAVAAAIVWRVLTFGTLLVARVVVSVVQDRELLEDPVFSLLLIHTPLLVAGGLGAFLSWRFGGRPWERLAAGASPVLVFFLSAVFVQLYSGGSPIVRSVVLLPAMFLLLGTLPFLVPTSPAKKGA
ncbi:MAG: hypothetical protein ACE5IP_08400 [Terriglobia bacterium]